MVIVVGGNFLQRESLCFEQKGRKVYLTSMSAAELFELCHVSRMTESQLDNESYYQREITTKKVNKIKKWWDSASSFLPNCILITFDDRVAFPAAAGAPVPNKHNQLVNYAFPAAGGLGAGSIQIANWVRNPNCIVCTQPMMNAVCQSPICGYSDKPGLILDGQHRVAGCSQNVANNGERLPVAILSPDVVNGGGFSQAEIGQTFIENNTFQTKIDKHIEMHLRKRFGVGDFDAGPAPRAGQGAGVIAAFAAATAQVVINERAYDLMRQLEASAAGNPLYDRVRVLKGQQNKYIDSHNLYNALRPSCKLAPAAGGLNGLALNASRDKLKLYFRSISDGWPAPDDWGNTDSHLMDEAWLETLIKLFPKFNLRATNLAAGVAAPGIADFNAAIADLIPLINWNAQPYSQYSITSGRAIVLRILQAWFPNAGGAPNIPLDPATGAPWTSLEDYLANAVPDNSFVLYPEVNIAPGPAAPPPVAGGRHQMTVADNPLIKWDQAPNAVAKVTIRIQNIAVPGDSRIIQKVTHPINGKLLTSMNGAGFAFTPGSNYDIEVEAVTPANNILVRTISISYI